MAVRRSKAMARIVAGQALMTKVEKLRLVELERVAAELVELERSLLGSMAETSVHPRLGRAYADHVGSVRSRLDVLDRAARDQAEKVLAQGAREKAAGRIYERVLLEETRADERAEMDQLIEAHLSKTSLP